MSNTWASGQRPPRSTVAPGLGWSARGCCDGYVGKSVAVSVRNRFASVRRGRVTLPNRREYRARPPGRTNRTHRSGRNRRRRLPSRQGQLQPPRDLRRRAQEAAGLQLHLQGRLPRRRRARARTSTSARPATTIAAPTPRATTRRAVSSASARAASRATASTASRSPAATATKTRCAAARPTASPARAIAGFPGDGKTCTDDDECKRRGLRHERELHQHARAGSTAMPRRLYRRRRDLHRHRRMRRKQRRL